MKSLGLIITIITYTVYAFLLVGSCSLKEKGGNEEQEKMGLKENAMLFNTILLICLIGEYSKHDYGAKKIHEILSIEISMDYNLIFSLGIDGISYFLVVLTGFIGLISVEFIEGKRWKALLGQLMLITIGLVLTFLSTNLIFFYIFFEALLIPLFLMVGVMGSKRSRVTASFYLVIYTLIGSFCLLIGIIYLYNVTNSLEFKMLNNLLLREEEQILLFILFFFPFAVKIPMWPFHIWLPAAHVEAPTCGSVILASLILKLGGYGIMRFIPWFPLGLSYWQPLIQVCGLIGVIYGACMCIIQFDLKRFVAYTSVSHMNMMLVGLVSKDITAIAGAYYTMVSHSIVSAALFICIGILYSRYHTRELYYYGGLSEMMPVFTIFYFVFTLSNMGAPLTPNFIGEFLIFTGLGQQSFGKACIIGLSIVLSSIYSIWVFNRLVGGAIKIKYIEKFTDVNKREFIILLMLAGILVIFGVAGNVVLEMIEVPCYLINIKNI